MASKLNPGADATLVSVAYRAAMADTPADYSGTLEKAAESYGKTMEASSEMWGNIAKVGASIGSEMMKNAQELTDAVAKGATLNPEDTRLFYDEIYGVKDELKALGPLSMFGDRETRLKRAELKAKQQELFADIDNAVANLKVGADAVAAGTFDANLAMGDGEIVNAIIKSNLKNNITENQNIAKLSRNENGELMYTLYNVENNPDGEVLTDENGKPRTMTIKQFNESIANNVKDGGAMKTAFGSLTEQESNAGNKALNGTYDPERKQMTLNKLDTLLGDKPVNLKRAMRTPIGYSNTSFFDDITKEQGEHSVGLYKDLLEATGGNVLTGKITEGMVDIDGLEGINEQEAMNANNYKILTGNIIGLKDPEASKAYFKQYAVKEMEAAYKYGYSKKPPVKGTETDDKNPYNLPKELKMGPVMPNGYQQKESRQQVQTWINSLKSGRKIQYMGSEYTFRDGNWVENYGIEGVEQKIIGSADNMRDDVFQTDFPAFDNIITEPEAEKIDHSTGKTASQNPFGDGAGEIAKLPSDFTKAVGNDDLKVKEYLDNMKIPGLNVKASGFGSDSITLSLGGKTKVFIVDTNFTDDEDRASEIWSWLHANWSADVNKNYYNLITD